MSTATAAKSGGAAVVMEFLSTHEGTFSSYDLAEKLGVSQSVANRILRLTGRGKPHRADGYQERLEMLMAWRDANPGVCPRLRDVAELLGVESDATAHRLCHIVGIPLRRGRTKQAPAVVKLIAPPKVSEQECRNQIAREYEALVDRWHGDGYGDEWLQGEIAIKREELIEALDAPIRVAKGMRWQYRALRTGARNQYSELVRERKR